MYTAEEIIAKFQAIMPGVRCSVKIATEPYSDCKVERELRIYAYIRESPRGFLVAGIDAAADNKLIDKTINRLAEDCRDQLAVAEFLAERKAAKT